MSLIEGEESHETRDQHLEELVRTRQAEEIENDLGGGEMDVLEV